MTLHDLFLSHRTDGRIPTPPKDNEGSKLFWNQTSIMFVYIFCVYVYYVMLYQNSEPKKDMKQGFFQKPPLFNAKPT